MSKLLSTSFDRQQSVAYLIYLSGFSAKSTE